MINSCQIISNKRPCVYKLGFTNRSMNNSNIVCIENHVYDIEYGRRGESFSESGCIKQIVINDNDFSNSFIILDRSWDNSYTTIKIFFYQIFAIKSVIANDAYAVAVQHGFKGSLSDWFISMRGSRGYSAYELAVQNGYDGTQEEWLASLTVGSDKLTADIKELDTRLSRAEAYQSTMTDTINEIQNKLGEDTTPQEILKYDSNTGSIYISTESGEKQTVTTPSEGAQAVEF